MLNLFDGAPIPSHSPEYIPAPLTFAGFLVVFLFAFWSLALFLPHPWFCWLFRLAFPFMPECLEDFGRKK